MRLTPEQAAAIRQAVAARLGADARVWLFGSRADDSLKGGDIDLFVESPTRLANRGWAACELAADIILRIGDQKIDVILADPVTPRQPIHEVARRTGVLLRACHCPALPWRA